MSAAALELGRSERTLWRWLARGTPRGSPSRGFVLTDAQRGAYLVAKGNAAAARRALIADGRSTPSLRTLQRAFARELRPVERANARGGERAARASLLYLRYEAEHRNSVWQADHKLLSVLVVPPRARRAQRPWATIFVDDFSRAVLGFAVSLRPSAADVLGALRESVLVDREHGGLGGLPERLRLDNGLEFAAGAVEQAALALGIQISPARPYSPHEKGKVERLNRTLSDAFLAGLPWSTEGPRRADGTLVSAGSPPLSLERFVGELSAWVDAYNAEHRHSALDGATPLERWRSDPTPLREISDEDARALLCARKATVVRRDGIHFRRHLYIAPELAELVGEQVEIAFAPHDERSVEVYWRGKWLASAHPQETLGPEERLRVLAERRELATTLRRQARRAAKTASTRLEPATAANPNPAEVTVLGPRTEPTRATAGHREAGRRAAARTDLVIPPGPPRVRR